MSGQRRSRLGPYTATDLRGLPGGGKGYELEDGWLVEVVSGARHNHVAQRLGRFIDAGAVGASVHLCVGSGWEISTRSGVRKPDIIVVPREVARAAVVAEVPKLIPGTEVRLAVEVIAPGSGTERTDRVRKVREYAAAGIPQYWIVEHQPDVQVHRMVLSDGTYGADPVVGPGAVFDAVVEADQPFRVTFDPAALLAV
ncbi:Uma2 family endonuclease [Nocardia brasiliensis]|uniref:Uma2 family endonuclease n=1 Tax=Nocardia brasiliensis TaxID=37326 RepID=UPI002457251C|nr:Uma2 family endonuclease [Nocardia brasiliensis]